MKTLKGRTALVTGASRGIGRAIAMQLAKEGALVAVHFGASHEAAEDVTRAIIGEGGSAFAIGADLSRIEAIERLFAGLDEEFERRTGTNGIDILVNNAGVGNGGAYDQTTPERFDYLMAINIRALFFVCQHALTRLRDGGRVINISSDGTRGAVPGIAAYAMTKIAANSLTLSLAAALGSRNITVNALLPGYVETDFTARLRSNPEEMERIIGQTVLGRAGQPQDIAGAVSLLTSSRSDWITGQLIGVTGGARL
jgi:NAD(P)-dependent dehydrogenase (short-subunit alcohol dehydrogenase family)